MAGFWLKTLRKISTKLVDETLRWNCLSKRLLGRTLFGEKLFRDSGKKAVQNFSWIEGGVCGTHLVTFTWTVQWTRFIGCSVYANIQGGNYVHYNVRVMEQRWAYWIIWEVCGWYGGRLEAWNHQWFKPWTKCVWQSEMSTNFCVNKSWSTGKGLIKLSAWNRRVVGRTPMEWRSA